MPHVDRFLESLEGLGVECTRTGGEGFRAALEPLLSAPSVGAPLPFDDLSLDGTDVVQAPTPGELKAAKTGVTAARMAIASYGSLLIRGRPDATEAVSLFPDRHVAILRASDIVPDMTAAFERLGPHLRDESTTAILATGPSATADMGALVRGAHGPKQVHVLLIESE